ncbi:MAG: AMP-binding protein, partial [Pseudomonadota bacterium]
TRLTYSQAREKADRLAIGLMHSGIKPRDRVLLQLPNWMEFVIAYFALQKIGAIVVLLIDRYRQYEINHLIQLTGATGWVVAEKYKKVDYIPIIEDVLKENPQVEHVVLARGTKGGPYLSLEKLIETSERTDQNLQSLADTRPDPMQVAHMGPTGGTTGLPKVVPRTHNSLICGSEYAARSWEMDIQDTCLLSGPLGHDLAFTKGLLGSILTLGRVVLLDSVEPADICEAVERERITAIVWVPTLAARLVQFEGLEKYDLSSLRKMHCGGGASLPDMIRSVREKLGCTFFNAYGATEGMTTMSRSGDDLETIFHTVGRPTCPYDTYRVVDPSGKPLPTNTSGELLIKGPGVFTGYYRAPEEDAKVFTEEGFFRTGDVAKIDESGYITLTGRIKEMINRGGESISATEIEKLIIDHPDVITVAVVPMPDPDMGERVCAYIQPRAGAELTFDRIIAFLKERKASVIQLPERIEFIEAMPLTKAEKIDKSFLRKDIEKKLGAIP